jgi:hypothetical protein
MVHCMIPRLISLSFMLLKKKFPFICLLLALQANGGWWQNEYALTWVMIWSRHIQLNIQLTIQFNPSSWAEDDEAQKERPIMVHWATHESVEWIYYYTAWEFYRKVAIILASLFELYHPQLKKKGWTELLIGYWAEYAQTKTWLMSMHIHSVISLH